MALDLDQLSRSGSMWVSLALGSRLVLELDQLSPAVPFQCGFCLPLFHVLTLERNRLNRSGLMFVLGVDQPKQVANRGCENPLQYQPSQPSAACGRHAGEINGPKPVANRVCENP